MKLLLLLALIGGLSIGCSSYRIVQNQADPSATWPAYRTFAFIDTSRIEPLPSATYRTAINQIEQAVATELTKRGYRQLDDRDILTPADLLVNIGVVVNEKTQTRSTTIYEAPLYTGQRRYQWRSQDVPVGTYQEGTLSLHIVDGKRNALIWDAAVTSVLNKKPVSSGQISEAVAKVFEKFPGKQN